MELKSHTFGLLFIDDAGKFGKLCILHWLDKATMASWVTH